MRRTTAAALALAPAFALAQAAAPAPAEDPLAYLGWLRELAGACWQGTDNAGRATDRQCYELQFGRFLRGTIEVGAVDGKPPAFRGDSLFHRDRRAGTVAVVMWGTNGLVNLGEARLEGGAIRFLQPRIEGRPEQRTSWTKAGTDSFRVAREQLEGGSWRETLVVTYRRIAP